MTTFWTRAPPKEEKWKMGPKWSRFRARNIPILFGVQFLSFLISMTKKCFGQILTTFPGLGTTGAGKVENRAWMTRFCTWNIPSLFGIQFLSFPISSVEKCFSSILRSFRVLTPLKHPKHTHTFLGCNSFRFPSVRLKNVSDEFWPLFLA